MSGEEGIEIRSFRQVFELERRLFRIDRWRLPLPYGVPVRGLAYALAFLVAVLVAGRLPVLGALVGLLPAPLRVVGLPCGAAWLLVRARVDGRAAHHHLRALMAFRLRARTLATLRPVRAPRVICIADDLIVTADAASSGYRRARVAGPARVALRAPAQLRRRGRTLHVTPTATPSTPAWNVVLDAGERLVVQRGRGALR